jgi:hypothetical protein
VPTTGCREEDPTVGAQRTSFDKLQRDRAKKAKAAAKRERRQSLDAAAPDEADESPEVELTDDGEEFSAAELLVRVEEIHRRFEAGTMSYDEFEERKVDLLSRLPID